MKFKSLIVFIAVCFGLTMVSTVAVQALTLIQAKTQTTVATYIAFLSHVDQSITHLHQSQLVIADQPLSDHAAPVNLMALRTSLAQLESATFTQVREALQMQGLALMPLISDQLVDAKALIATNTALQEISRATLALIENRSQDLIVFSRQTMQRVLGTSAVAAIIVIFSQLFLYRSVVLRVNRLTSQFTRIASGAGNLNVKMDIGGRDELTALGDAFNGFIDRIRASLAEAVEALEELQDVSDMSKFFEVHGIVSDKLNEQAVQINMVAIASEEMTQAVSSVAESAAIAADMVQVVKGSANDGERVARDARDKISQLVTEVGQTSGHIHSLSESSSSIRSVVNLIREIAEQTNLLALNAAIEAARAGETGRGFAVVADEVRALASRTAQSTNDIEVKINQIAEIAESTVAVMGSTVKVGGQADTSSVEASNAFREIVTSVTSMAEHNFSIASATTKQKSTIDDIVDNIQLINIVAQNVIPEALMKISEQAARIEQVRDNVDRVDRTLQGLRG